MISSSSSGQQPEQMLADPPLDLCHEVRRKPQQAGDRDDGRGDGGAGRLRDVGAAVAVALGRQPAGALPAATRDEIVEQPKYHLTHAVAIDAPVQAVWPWLAPLGQGRGGLYSYDWLENLVGCDIHSLDRIDPQLQQLAPGDMVGLVPEDFRVPLRFQVAQVDPPCALVLRGAGTRQEAIRAGLPFPFWAFVLRPRQDGSTRLLARWRSDFRAGVADRLTNQYRWSGSTL
jgi:hypothetical protein